MSDKQLCKEFLELLLHIAIEDLTYPEAQKPFKDAIDSRGIRLDFYTSDPENTFDVEVQTTYQKDILFRARYYTSCMDVD